MNPKEDKGKRKAVRRVLAARLIAFYHTLNAELDADQNSSPRDLLARAERAVSGESGRHGDSLLGHRKYLV